MGEGLGVLRTGLALGSVADVGDEEVGADLVSLSRELPVVMGGDRGLLYHRPAAHYVGEARSVGVCVGLVEH